MKGLYVLKIISLIAQELEGLDIFRLHEKIDLLFMSDTRGQSDLVFFPHLSHLIQSLLNGRLVRCDGMSKL